jgi:hypothetical protein
MQTRVDGSLSLGMWQKPTQTDAGLQNILQSHPGKQGWQGKGSGQKPVLCWQSSSLKPSEDVPGTYPALAELVKHRNWAVE